MWVKSHNCSNKFLIVIKKMWEKSQLRDGHNGEKINNCVFFFIIVR